MLSPKEGPHANGTLIEVDGNGRDYTAEIGKFKQDRGIRFVLAFSGGAEKGVAVEPEKLIDGILTRLRGFPIAVLTGGTKGGVPEMANAIARQHNFPTIGVYPLAAAEKWALSRDELDLSVCVHPFVGTSLWGDESAIYTKLLDSVIVVGGNAGTMIEVSHLLKMNEKKASKLAEFERLEEQSDAPGNAERIEKLRTELGGLKLRHIVPVYGTGGVADALHFFPGKPETMARCMPPHLVYTAKQVYNYLIKADVLTEDEY